jgi:hypothetical protein
MSPDEGLLKVAPLPKSRIPLELTWPLTLPKEA